MAAARLTKTPDPLLDDRCQPGAWVKAKAGANCDVFVVVEIVRGGTVKLHLEHTMKGFRDSASGEMVYESVMREPAEVVRDFDLAMRSPMVALAEQIDATQAAA